MGNVIKINGNQLKKMIGECVARVLNESRGLENPWLSTRDDKGGVSYCEAKVYINAERDILKIVSEYNEYLTKELIEAALNVLEQMKVPVIAGAKIQWYSEPSTNSYGEELYSEVDIRNEQRLAKILTDPDIFSQYGIRPLNMDEVQDFFDILCEYIGENWEEYDWGGND